MTQPQFFLQPLAAAICVACYSSTVFANQPESKTQLAPIVVTAQLNSDANGLIIHADPKQPIQPIPATDGAAYLKSIPGFNSVASGGTNGDVSFRGMLGSRIKVLNDGSEELGACPARMDSPTSYISPESFDRITVIKGPQTVLYPTPGSAATVLFEKDPIQFEEGQNYKGVASVVAGSYGRLDHNVDTAVGNDNVYARLNANRSTSNDYQDGDGKKVHSNWERWGADLALGWTPTENTWFELKGGKGDGESAYAGRSMDGSQFKRESLGLYAEQKNINDVIRKIDAQVNYSFNDHIMDNFSLREVPVGKMPMAMEVTRRTLNTRVSMTTDWDKFSLVSGVDSQYNKQGGNMYMRGKNVPPILGTLSFQSYGAFTEATIPVNPQHKVVTGARFDHVEVENLVNNNTRTDTVPSGFIRLESKIPDHGFSSYIGLGYVERTPDFWEIYSTSLPTQSTSQDSMGHDMHHDGMHMPKAKTINTMDRLDYLKNEKTLQLDLGYQFEHGHYNSWASAYFGVIKDFMVVKYADPNKSQMRPPIRNVDARIAGAELGVGYKFTDHIQSDMSLAYAWGENTTDNTALPQISPLEGRFNLRYVADDYSVGLLWRAVAKQNRISLYEGNVVGYDMGKSKAFNTLSLNAAYKLTKNTEWSVGVDNLFDETYADHLNKGGTSTGFYPENEQFNNIGRNYWTRVSMKF